MLTIFHVLYMLMVTGFATRKATKKCKVFTSISLVSLSPREGNILYLFTERRLEPGPARNSSPGVSPWWEQSGGTDAVERCQCPAFWAWQMRSRVRSHNSKCHFVALTTWLLLCWKYVCMEWLRANSPGASPLGSCPSRLTWPGWAVRHSNTLTIHPKGRLAVEKQCIRKAVRATSLPL